MVELGFQVLSYKQGDLIMLFLNQTRSLTWIYLLVKRYGAAKDSWIILQNDYFLGMSNSNELSCALPSSVKPLCVSGCFCCTT